MPSDLLRPRGARGGLFPAAVAILIFATLSILAAVNSDGFLTGDACTHYLFARFAFHNPIYLVNVWGRPMVTGLDMLPALVAGRLGVRFFSLGLAIGCGLLAWRWAFEQQLRWPVLALIFTLGQPWLFLHSFSEMTELPFALVLGLAFWAWMRRRWLAMTCLAALLPWGRPEGFGFLVLAAGALAWEGREDRKLWAYLPILIVPLVVWDVAGWKLAGDGGAWWRWLASAWPWSVQSSYRRGNILAFVGQLPVITGPIVLPATLVGIAMGLPNPRASAGGRAGRGVHFAMAVIPIAILVAHSLLYWLGKFSSDGEARYLLIVAPFWGVLSATGWEWIFATMRWRRPIAWAALAAVSPVVFNFFIPVVPVRADQPAQRFADWYRKIVDRYPRLIATDPAVFYDLDRDPSRMPRQGPALLAWDPVYGSHNADANLVVDPGKLRQSGWIELPSAESAINALLPPEQRWRVFTK